MDMRSAINDVLRWKKDDIDGIRERMLIAIRRSDAHESMKDLLLENSENEGKMLRPLLMLMAAEDYASNRREKLLWSAAAGEMIHSASLIFDDIIDEAPLRRGKPSMNAKYGTPSSICAGMFQMSNAYSCLAERGFYDTLEDLLRVTGLVCDGELIQDQNRYNSDFSEELYMRSIRGKTAVVFSYSAKVAARISDHDERSQKIFSDFGMALGMAFQLRDDLMDWTKSEEELGKPVCEDFVNGNYTLPVIFTLKNKEYRDEMLRVAAKKGDLNQEDIAHAKVLIKRSGGIDYAQSVLDLELKKAEMLLDRLPKSRYIITLKKLVRALR